MALSYLDELADTQETYGDWQGLLSSCERIVPFARELRNTEAEARAWFRIGNARIQRGHHDLALPALQIALRIFENIGNTRLALSCRQSLGNTRLAVGDVDGAMAEFRLVAEGPSWMNRWQGVVSLSAAYEQQGDYRRALSECEKAVEIVGSASGASESAIESARSYVLSNQANVYLACGDFENAAALSRELLLSAERVNQRDQFIEALINLSVCDCYRANWSQASVSSLACAPIPSKRSDRRPA